jgi:hypothetical protein
MQELLAWSRGLERVVLTVQTANHAALAFYRQQGYGADPTSPEECDQDEFGPEDRSYKMDDGSMGFPYRILCKERPTRPTRQQPQTEEQTQEAAAVQQQQEEAEEEAEEDAPRAAKRRRQAAAAADSTKEPSGGGRTE